MAFLHPPVSPTTDVHERARTRWAMAVTGVALLAATGGLAAYTTSLAHQHEARVLAGDYAAVHLENGAVEVEDSGEVVAPGRRVVDLNRAPRYVASLKLTPPGRYQAVLLADDGVAGHRQKAEMVIGAQDEQGAWHPASASSLLARIKVPTPGASL